VITLEQADCALDELEKCLALVFGGGGSKKE
jgi:hypothetical protein